MTFFHRAGLIGPTLAGYTWRRRSPDRATGGFVNNERRYDLDWLRALAVAAVFLFHCGMLFNQFDWHIKNSQLSPTVHLINLFISLWVMPAFFLISGSAACFSLNRRGGAAFAWERIGRLLIPLLFGTIVLVSPQVYLERLNDGEFSGSYWQFIPQFFQGVYPHGNFGWHHLWYLAYLLVFSLIAGPLFAWFRSPAGRRVVEMIAGFSSGAIGLLTWAIPLALIEVALRSSYPDGNQNLIADWANFLKYFTIFIYGYLIAAQPDIGRAISRVYPTALITALILTAAGAGVHMIVGLPGWGDPGWPVFMFLRAVAGWAWLTALLGYAGRRLNFRTPLLDRFNEAVLPFYMLHQTVIVAVGFLAVRQPWSLAVKYLTVITVSLGITMALYAFVVRPFWPIRLLFGMKRR